MAESNSSSRLEVRASDEGIHLPARLVKQHPERNAAPLLVNERASTAELLAACLARVTRVLDLVAVARGLGAAGEHPVLALVGVAGHQLEEAIAIGETALRAVVKLEERA